MKKSSIEKLKNVPQIPHGDFEFINDLKQPLTQDCRRKLKITLQSGFENSVLIQSAVDSLLRLSQKDGEQFTVNLKVESGFEFEEYSLEVGKTQADILASDSEGFRRGLYLLSDKLCAETEGKWRRKPFVKHRISRCFFGPTYRAPFFIDELTNDVDYYPDEYLNKLAYEGVNGLWLTMYFKDFPSDIFLNRPANADVRLAKLQKTIDKCARFGIKIYVFFSEPKLFGDASFAVPEADAAKHPELVIDGEIDLKFFCTSSEFGKRYLEQSVAFLFQGVTGLGGIINIMYGEDNGSCVAALTGGNNNCKCPVCRSRNAGEIFAESASIMSKAMHKFAPEAEFIGWFYAPGQRDDTQIMEDLAAVADCWPEDCVLMLNFESGGTSMQLGKKRTVFDYSLAYLGPSKLFELCAKKVKKMGAKLQVGCSHEDASVPFIPVPSNLYEKYKFMHEYKICAVMQCWYFGNYPGLMNKAAGELSFEKFPESEAEFLMDLARPCWGENSPAVVKAWQNFAAGYREFPANIAFEWYGPLHQSIAWPLHLFPVDEPISPSWIFKSFPEIAGDRIGECLCFYHNLNEAIVLVERMAEFWHAGVELMTGLIGKYQDNPARLADIGLAQAVELQIKSTLNVLRFYYYREELIFDEKIENLPKLKAIVESEIVNSQKMIELCKKDARLGYHPEAEGYLFFSANLAVRIELLQELLVDDFPKFRLDLPEIQEYAGKIITGKKVVCRRSNQPCEIQNIGDAGTLCASYDEKNLYLEIGGMKNIEFNIDIEPCRLWVNLKLHFDCSGKMKLYDFIWSEIPEIGLKVAGDKKFVTIPLKIFDGFRRPCQMMRINLRSEKASLVDGKLWPGRLLHDSHPHMMANLIFEK